MINVGDVIRLKSGGPTMTVERVIPGIPERLACLWFVGDVAHEGTFATVDLEKVDE